MPNGEKWIWNEFQNISRYPLRKVMTWNSGVNQHWPVASWPTVEIISTVESCKELHGISIGFVSQDWYLLIQNAKYRPLFWHNSDPGLKSWKYYHLENGNPFIFHSWNQSRNWIKWLILLFLIATLKLPLIHQWLDIHIGSVDCLSQPWIHIERIDHKMVPIW